MRASSISASSISASSIAASSIAAWAIAAIACGDASPADDAPLATLSSEEVVALCDELRDAVSLEDHPIECQESQIHWVLPTNQSCRAAELTDCGATAGDVRRWHEVARRDPCSVPHGALPAGFERPSLQRGCGELVPQVRNIETPCATTGLSSLERFDGVYDVTASQVPPEVGCPWTLPAVLDRSAPRFVLVSTEASGVPELILKSCGAVADCQVLAREIRAFGDPEGTAPDAYRFDHFALCDGPPPSDAFIAQSRSPDGASCEHPWVPRSELMMLVEQVMLSDAEVTVIVRSGPRTQPASPGCGYVELPSPGEREACFSTALHEATRVAPL